MADSIRLCTLTDGHAGNVRQALALARALGGSAHDIVLQPRAPWRWLAPRALPGADRGFGDAFAALAVGCAFAAFVTLFAKPVKIQAGGPPMDAH